MEKWNGWNQIAGAVWTSGMDSDPLAGAPEDEIEGAAPAPATGAGEGGLPPVDAGTQPAGMPPEPLKGKPSPKDKPPTQERFDEVYGDWKRAEELVEALQAEIEEMRMSRMAPQPYPLPAQPPKAEPGLKLPRHLQALMDDPQFGPYARYTLELAQEIANQGVAPLKAEVEKMQREANFARTEQREAAERDGWRSQFETHGQSVLKELDLGSQFHQEIVDVIFSKASEQMFPLIQSWQNLPERLFWVKFKQQFKANLESTAARFRPLVVKPEAMPPAPGTPVSSRLPSAAPIATPDPMMDKLIKGEAEPEDVLHDFLARETKKRSKV